MDGNFLHLAQDEWDNEQKMETTYCSPAAETTPDLQIKKQVGHPTLHFKERLKEEVLRVPSTEPQTRETDGGLLKTAV